MQLVRTSNASPSTLPTLGSLPVLESIPTGRCFLALPIAVQRARWVTDVPFKLFRASKARLHQPWFRIATHPQQLHDGRWIDGRRMVEHSRSGAASQNQSRQPAFTSYTMISVAVPIPSHSPSFAASQNQSRQPVYTPDPRVAAGPRVDSDRPMLSRLPDCCPTGPLGH